MVAEQRREGGQFDPASEQRRRRRTVKSADVRAHKGDSADAQIEHHLRGKAKMVPGRGIVAGPSESVALAAGISRAG